MKVRTGKIHRAVGHAIGADAVLVRLVALRLTGGGMLCGGCFAFSVLGLDEAALGFLALDFLTGGSLLLRGDLRVRKFELYGDMKIRGETLGADRVR